MSRKWYQDGDELRETADGTGCVRIGYDADSGEYHWQRPDGAILTGRGYGPLKLYRLPNGEPASEQWQRMYNSNYRAPGEPVRPCRCCGKDRVQSDVAQCDCEGSWCPVNRGLCAMHCGLADTRGKLITHWHFDKDHQEIPANQIVVRSQLDTLFEMMKAGVIPWSFTSTGPEYFEERKESKLKAAWKSLKYFMNTSAETDSSTGN